MKKIILSIIFISLLLTSCTSNQDSKLNLASKEQETYSDDLTIINTTEPSSTPNTKIYDIEQIATHNSKADCWIVYKGKVYDVTPFVKLHPGGEDKISKGCGIDATSLIENNHPNLEKVLNIASKYSIGEVK